MVGEGQNLVHSDLRYISLATAKYYFSKISWRTVYIFLNFVVNALKAVLEMHLSCVASVISRKFHLPICDFFFPLQLNLTLICGLIRLSAEAACHKVDYLLLHLPNINDLKYRVVLLLCIKSVM